MAIFNCKSCGGDLEIQDGTTVVTCEYCGRQQTVPSADNEKKVNLFNRANRLRSKCDFDKAASVYEGIVAEFPQESEAYWGLCLCKFGIEYVDDPATANKIPTCHRTSYESIFDDSNFDLACENADALAVSVYRSEAKEIDRLQKEILEIAKNEKPFDVFICYKESDDMGGRTVDSELAHDIYDVLTEKGYKVFYSRITLKSKLGQDYEPYIFSALNSAKVMLSIGTKFEYFNAVWVKNEWSRFLALMKNDKSKMLIPCYRDIDPYDMPREFSNLQGQDLSSPRAFQDLVTNIEKIIPKNLNTRGQSSQQTAAISASPSIEPLLKRAFMCLEDSDWEGADKCCEKILDVDPENAQTYLVKLLIECKLQKEELLGETSLEFKASNNFTKIMRYGSEDIKKRMDRYCNTQLYNETVKLMENAKTRGEYEEVKKRFLSLGNFLEAPQKVNECDEIIAKFPGYDEAVKLMGSENIEDILQARDMFLSLGDYFDSQDRAKECQRIYEKEEVEPRYRKAVMALECSSDLTELRNAREKLLGLSDYRDAAQKAAECQTRISKLEKGDKGTTGRTQNEPKKIKPPKTASDDPTVYASTISADDLAVISKPLKSDEKSEKSDLENKKNHRGTIVAVILAVIAIAAIFIIIAVNKKPEDDTNSNDSYSSGQSTPGEKPLTTKSILQKYKENRGLANKNLTISAYDQTVAVKSDGTIITVGNYKSQRDSLAKWENVVSIDNGPLYTVGLKSDGTVITTDYYNAYEVSKWSDIVAVSAGNSIISALKKDGTVVTVGNSINSSTDMLNWKDIVAIDSGNNLTVGLKSNGTVVASSGDGNRFNLSGWRDVVAISTSGLHVVGLKSDGTVVAAKPTNANDPSGICNVSAWKDIVAISAGGSHTVGLKANGTVVAVGGNQYGQCNVSDWKDIIAVVAGNYHTVGLKADGTVVATGNNDYGQCNVSDWKNIALPRAVAPNSSSKPSSTRSQKYDLSMINTILNTKVGDLMVQSFNVEDSYFGYSMNYKGYDIIVMADKYNGNIKDGYPTGLNFSPDLLIPGRSSYTLDELKEIFGDKMKVEYIYDEYYRTEGYHVTAELNHSIIFTNGTATVGYENENLTEPFNGCTIYT